MKDSQNAVWTPRESNEKSQTSQPTSQGSFSNHGLTRPTVRGKFLYCRDESYGSEESRTELSATQENSPRHAEER